LRAKLAKQKEKDFVVFSSRSAEEREAKTRTASVGDTWDTGKDGCASPANDLGFQRKLPVGSERHLMGWWSVTRPIGARLHDEMLG
jgi:hypothetical protein